MTRGSKSYQVVLADLAERDLVAVSDWYIERHPAGEQRFFKTFERLRRLLAKHPRAGRERSDLGSALRSSLVHPYVAFYVVDDGSRTAKVTRVIHAHMDVDEDDIED